MQVTKVEAYEAEDGQVFKTEAMAISHNAELARHEWDNIRKEKINEFLCEYVCNVEDYDNPDPYEYVRAFLEHGEELIPWLEKKGAT